MNTGAHEHAWQQQMLRVRENGAQGNRAGAFIDRHIGELQLAFQRIGVAVFHHQLDVAVIGFFFNVPLRHRVFQAQEVGAGLGNIHIHRIELLNGCQFARLTTGDKRAFGDVRFTDATADWRGHFCPCQIDSGALQRRFRCRHARLGLMRVRHRLVILLFADVLRARQRRVTFYRQTGHLRGSLRFREVTFGALPRRLVHRRIDLIQRVACVDIRAFGKLTAKDNAAHLRANLSYAKSARAARQFRHDLDGRGFYDMHGHLRCGSGRRLIRLIITTCHP
ncbi:hypothetical protein BN129_3688 [Cronobacter sakazakii 701]|nr:hypothetical protein BN129_3688 [Cronobacter sakazakii 701]